MGLPGARILALPVERALAQLRTSGERFDLVFLDPPYDLQLLAPTLAALVEHDILLPRATIVCEHHGRDAAVPAPSPVTYRETRTFGDVALSFYGLAERNPDVTVALYPGSFDPVTYGHINIIERGLKIFDHLIVGVAVNVRKTPLFLPEERAQMIRESVEATDRLTVDTFEGLLIEYAKRCGASVILRGLRAISDFEFEFQMAHMNRRLAPKVETIFMMTGEDHFYVSSQLVREIAAFRGDLSGLVPDRVAARLRQRFAP